MLLLAIMSRTGNVYHCAHLSTTTHIVSLETLFTTLKPPEHPAALRMIQAQTTNNT